MIDILDYVCIGERVTNFSFKQQFFGFENNVVIRYIHHCQTMPSWCVPGSSGRGGRRRRLGGTELFFNFPMLPPSKMMMMMTRMALVDYHAQPVWTPPTLGAHTPRSAPWSATSLTKPSVVVVPTVLLVHDVFATIINLLFWDRKFVQHVGQWW
jgi:hypothetical protein